MMRDINPLLLTYYTLLPWNNTKKFSRCVHANCATDAIVT